MSKGITQENMLSVLPGVLARDKGMYDLAQLVGWIIEANTAEIDAPAIFQHIDDLPEDLLDILAKDCKVDWYDYDADIATKRRQLKDNWSVRKRIGTVSAVKTALRNVWPDTTVEEWYEYGGKPGYFQVLLSLDTEGCVNFSKAARMLELFKPVRAHSDGYIILRVRYGIVIHSSKKKYMYHVPAAGTVPKYSTHGDKSYDNIVVESKPGSAKYHVPYTGKSIAGTYPYYMTHGNKSYEDIVVQSDLDGTKYHAPATGQEIAGTYPHYMTHGNKANIDIDIQSESDGKEYHVPLTGTYPNYSTHGNRSSTDIDVISDSSEQEYHVPIAGTRPNYSTHGRRSHGDIVMEPAIEAVGYHVPKTGEMIVGNYPNHYSHGNKTVDGIEVAADEDGTTYSVPVSGTIPGHTTHGEVDGGGMNISSDSVSAGYGVRKCGTSNKSLF